MGFELRSDAWASLRGAEGVLISTRARAGHGASVTSTQMDVLESVAQLKAAQGLSAAMTTVALHQNALASAAANQAQVSRISALDQQQQGKYSAPVNGHSAQKATPGTRELNPAQPVEKFASALVHLEGPNNINLASPASTFLFAGQHLHWATQGDSHWAAACTVAAVSGNATSLFSHQGGIQAIAGNGPLSLQAHTDQLELLADQEITVISVNDQISINAKQKITLMAGQSSVTLDGGNITFTCPANFTVNGAQHTFSGAAKKAAELGKLPDTRVKLHIEQFRALDMNSNKPIVGQPYRIEMQDGTILRGSTDEFGKTQQITTADPESIKVYWEALEPESSLTAPYTHESC
jgi:type VI secretion system secreted protein VgrG